MNEANLKLADELQKLCCAETESKFFDLVTDSIGTILTALRASPEPDLLLEKWAGWKTRALKAESLLQWWEEQYRLQANRIEELERIAEIIREEVKTTSDGTIHNSTDVAKKVLDALARPRRGDPLVPHLVNDFTDQAWDKINALGGTKDTDSSYDHGIFDTVEKALEIIEALGGMDPKQRALIHPQPDGTLLDTICSVCGEKQFNTPSGVSCKNGHGGAS